MRSISHRRQMALVLVACWSVCVITAARAEGASDSKSKPGKPSKGIPAKTLAPLLKSKSEPLWDKGLARVTSDSLDDAEIVKEIIKFVDREARENRFSPALGRALTLLGAVEQPDVAQRLAPLLASHDYRIAMMTADAVAMNRSSDQLESLKKLVDRPEFETHYGFRRCVMDAVAKIRDKSAVDFLIERLDASDGQLKYEIAMSLQRITGQQFGGISDDWEKWWDSNRNEFVFPASERLQSITLNAPPKPIPWNEPRPDFYGMRVYAKRVVFVIDRSGSMRYEIDGVTRLERAQQELQQAIMALSPSDHFNIVAFDDRMDVLSRRLLPANQENKLEGIRYAHSLTPRGGTACYEPLKMGLEASNDLELILFVSDGEPTAGALVDPAEIVTAISNHNLTQRTTINTLGIDARDQHERFLKNLAEKNAGKLLLIR